MTTLLQNDEPDAPVFLHYTQRELDRNFDQRGWASNALEVIARYGERSALARRQLAHESIAYGATPDEVLDVFPASGRKPPVLVFLHGGAWRHFTRHDFSFVACALAPAGITVIVPGFASLPQVRLPEMVAQVRRAMDWTCANVDRLGGDPESVHLAGWSSGAHLAATALIAGGEGAPSSAACFQSITCISAPFDLEPVLLSARSSYVKITRDEACQLSPRQNVQRYRTPFVVISAERDTDEFQRQSDDFAAALMRAGRPVARMRFPCVNHFELVDTLGDAGSALSCFLISHLKRPPADHRIHVDAVYPAEKEKTMPRLRHFAIVVSDLEKSANFYEKVFELKRVGQETLDFAAAIYLSDGVINLALLNYFGKRGSGLDDAKKFVGAHHFGFQVEDIASIQKRIEEAGGTFFFDLGDDQEKENFERKFKDPDGIIFDISKRGWLGATG